MIGLVKSSDFVKLFLSYSLVAVFLFATDARLAAQPVIYSEGFDSPVGANGDVYFTDSPSYNGITDGTSSGGITTGASFAGNSNENGEIRSSVTAGYGTISAPQAGSDFLYENTNKAFTAPIVVFSTQGTTINLTTNTNYTFSFYLNNQDNISEAVIQPTINGVAIGSTLSATGVNSWEQFSVNWNSGSATSGVFELDNSNLNGNGNDFGIDTIQVTTVPEPGQWATWALVLVLGLVFVHRAISRSKRFPARA